MWALLAVFSSILLGLYDAAKKQALKKNGVLAVLLVATAFSTLFVSPFLRLGPVEDHLKLALKAVLVTASWISGMVGLKLLPLTTVSTIKGSRPVFVVLFSIILYGEVLSVTQWVGVVVVLAALFLLGRTSRSDAPVQVRKAGFIWMGVSIVTGVASALYDKHIMQGMEPLFVQAWTNLYITILLALCIACKALASGNFASLIPPTANAAGPSRLRDHGWSRFPEANASQAVSPQRAEGMERSDTGGVGGSAPRPLGVQGDNSSPNAVERSDTGDSCVAAQGGTPPCPLGVQGDNSSPNAAGLRWDWTLLVVAVLITGADALYFFALKQPDALLSVISLIRRAAVIITFVCGAVFFKEGNIKAKGLNLLLMATGVVLLLIGT